MSNSLQAMNTRWGNDPLSYGSYSHIRALLFGNSFRTQIGRSSICSSLCSRSGNLLWLDSLINNMKIFEGLVLSLQMVGESIKCLYQLCVWELFSWAGRDIVQGSLVNSQFTCCCCVHFVVGHSQVTSL